MYIVTKIVGLIFLTLILLIFVPISFIAYNFIGIPIVILLTSLTDTKEEWIENTKDLISFEVDSFRAIVEIYTSWD